MRTRTMMCLTGLGLLGLTGGILARAATLEDPVSRISSQLANMVLSEQPDDPHWSRRLTDLDGSDPTLAAQVHEALTQVRSATAVAQAMNALLTGPASPEQRERWRLATVECLRFYPEVARSFLYRQADQAWLIEQSATAAITVRAQIEVLWFASASTAWPAPRQENRRRWAGILAQAGRVQEGRELLIDEVFSGPEAGWLAGVYRGLLAHQAGDHQVVNAMLTSLTDSATSAPPLACFAAGYMSTDQHDARRWWQQGITRLEAGSPGIRSSSAAFQLLCQQRRSGIHAGDPVKVIVWTWAGTFGLTEFSKATHPAD